MNFNLKFVSNYNVVRHFSVGVSGNQRKNHYDSLEITPKATQGDVKNAFYRLSKQFHPDINKDNPSAAGKFRDIAEAYEILGNVKSRKLYDRGFSLRSTVEDDYQSSEPVVEKYKHASFYHHRNKPISKDSANNKTNKYNIDEWTKLHYSEMFNKAFNKKQGGVADAQEKFQTRAENESLLQVLGGFALIIGMTLMYITNPAENYDNPSSFSPEDQE